MAEIFLQSTNLVSCSLGTQIASPNRDITHKGLAIRIKTTTNKLGFASGTFSAVEAILAQALKNAGHSKSLSGVGFPSSSVNPPKDLPLFDEALLGIDTNKLLEMLHSIESSTFSNLSDYQFSYDIHRVSENFVIMNTNGLIAKEENAWITAQSVVRYGERWGYAETFNHRFDHDEITTVGHQALDSLKEYSSGESIINIRERIVPTATKLPLVWSYKAIADLLAYSLAPALGRSIDPNFQTKRDQNNSIPLFSQALSIYDDPHIPYGIGSHQIDQEGINTEKRMLVDHGYFTSLLSTYFDDNKGGNAYRAQYFSDIERNFEVYPREMPSNLVLDAPKLEQGNIFNIPQGIYIRGVVGVHDSIASTGEFSITASECFVIDHGDKDPLGICHISGNVYDLLNSIIIVSKSKKLIHPVSSPFGIFTPMIVTEGGVSLLIK